MLSEQGSRQFSAFICVHQPDGFKDLLTGDFCCYRLFVLPGLGCCRGQVLGVEVCFDPLGQLQPGLVLRVGIGVHQDSGCCVACVALNRLEVTIFNCWDRLPQKSSRVNVNLSGRGPSICCCRPFCRLKAPLGLSLLRYASQTRTFENTSLSAACKKKQGKLWQKERGVDGASPLDKEKHKALYYNKAIRTG